MWPPDLGATVCDRCGRLIRMRPDATGAGVRPDLDETRCDRCGVLDLIRQLQSPDLDATRCAMMWTPDRCCDRCGVLISMLYIDAPRERCGPIGCVSVFT
jgi:hypothetical protein